MVEWEGWVVYCIFMSNNSVTQLVQCSLLLTQSDYQSDSEQRSGLYTRSFIQFVCIWHIDFDEITAANEHIHIKKIEFDVIEFLFDVISCISLLTK